MSKFLNILKQVGLYIWQLPQNLVGLVVLCFTCHKEKCTVAGIDFYYSKTFPGGISLGKYVIIGSKNENTVKHEHGHQIQSMYLGPLYLIVIGLPSLIWAWLYGPVIPYTRNGYYRFYTEKWAEKLGKVER
jgi:hypothetical protein